MCVCVRACVCACVRVCVCCLACLSRSCQERPVFITVICGEQCFRTKTNSHVFLLSARGGPSLAENQWPVSHERLISRTLVPRWYTGGAPFGQRVHQVKCLRSATAADKVSVGWGGEYTEGTYCIPLCSLGSLESHLLFSAALAALSAYVGFYVG